MALQVGSGSSVDNADFILLLASSTYTASRPFLLLVLPLQRGEGGGTKQLGGDTAKTAN